MKIGVLGSGAVAKVLAAGFMRHGHQVMMGTREPGKLATWAAEHPGAVVVFGGAQSLLGTIFSALAISQSQSTLEFFLTGSMAKVLTLLFVIGLLMLRPQGLFVLKVRR